MEGQFNARISRLERMQDSETEGGGGGGVTHDLIRGTMSQDENLNISIALDKTFQECVNLINNGVNSICVTAPNSVEIFHIMSFHLNNYTIDILTKSPSNQTAFFTFSASTENDYPILRVEH